MNQAAHAPQVGMTLLEVLIAGGIGLLMSGLVGYLFVRQSKNYQDMQSQVRLQGQVARAQQLLTREITNIGAGMPDGSNPFTMNRDTLAFDYIDLKGKHCPVNNTVSITYKIIPNGTGKALVRDRRCDGGTPFRESMITCDSMTIKFEYFKPDRSTATDPNLVKLIEYEFIMFAKGKGNLFMRQRTGKVQVWLGGT